jgi:hypothetical protein
LHEIAVIADIARHRRDQERQNLTADKRGSDEDRVIAVIGKPKP